MEARRREMIVYKYELHECPPESEWGKHSGTLRQIADYLEMPDPCDYTSIRQCLERHLNGQDIWYPKAGGGRKRLLTNGEALIAADALKRGHGRDQATHIANAWREKKGGFQ